MERITWNIDIYLKDGAWREIPHFSTEWEGMGVLVEEANKQEMYLASGKKTRKIRKAGPTSCITIVLLRKMPRACGEEK
ncbi:hypothetical protein GPJ61_05865 [Brevibacillus formosus]|uniref:hypothetical protein n=1 Tax=Brevibacillus formosus TaxID=54913 RepID=UPI001CA53C5B|nr:hypothetical protein [Brevibacillus formosus]MBW5467397.1 hypothetical protein [Brevibacillus formosus]